MASAVGIAACWVALSASAVQAGDENLDQAGAPNIFSTLEHHPADSHRVPAGLDDVDAVAALDGIRIALTEVGDGGTYVWHRRDGMLSGMAQPLTSFKDPGGRPCRRLTVMLNTYGRSSRIDGTACRTAAGRWQLDG